MSAADGVRAWEDVCVLGDWNLGGVRMRGGVAVEALGCQRMSIQSPAAPASCIAGRWRAILLVKYGYGQEPDIRQRCHLLIWDPLDCWAQKDVPPVPFFRDRFRVLRPDIVLATSPSAQEVFETALKLERLSSVRVLLWPHHHDPRLEVSDAQGRSMWDADGPVRYQGELRYIESIASSSLGAALAKLKRRDGGPRQYAYHGSDENPAEALKHTWLVLHPRGGKSATEINRLCKPQVKVANALAVRLPILATDCPSVQSLYRISFATQSEWTDPTVLSAILESAAATSVALSGCSPSQAVEELRSQLVPFLLNTEGRRDP